MLSAPHNITLTHAHTHAVAMTTTANTEESLQYIVLHYVDPEHQYCVTQVCDEHNKNVNTNIGSGIS